MRRGLLILIPAIGVLIAFLLMEIALRTFYWAAEEKMLGLTPKRTTLEWVDNSALGRGLKASQEGWFVPKTNEYSTLIEVNSKGWRDSEHFLEKSEDTYRIVILGDSFVENFQVPLENTFFRQLEKELGRKLNKKIEVITIGLGNTGPAQQYVALKEYGLKYEPDLVVQMFLTANDIKNNSPRLNNNPIVPYLKIDVEGKIEVIPPERDSSSPRIRLKETLKKSRFVELLLSIRQRFLEKIEHEKYDYPLDYHVYDINYSKDYEEAWSLTKNIILKTKELSEQKGANYILVTLTNNEQVNKEVWQKTLETYPKMKGANLDLEKPDKILKEFCEKKEINCRHMLPFFKEHLKNNPGEITHYPLDGHWNETGTNLAADFILRNLAPLIEGNL